MTRVAALARIDRLVRYLVRMVPCIGSLLIASTVCAAGPQLEIVVGPDAPELERFAANELAGSLRKLFAAETKIATQPTFRGPSILLGSPSSNPAVKTALVENWPKLSPQGHILRSVKVQEQTALVVGGATPQATLWAAYELAHRLGMRSLLQGDFPPVDRRPFSLDGLDVLVEPTVQIRAWRTLEGGPVGWEAWGLEDHRRMLKQLTKLKINRVILVMGSAQPFVHFESGGISKKTGELFSGRQFPVSGDTAGRKAFRGISVFQNPDFNECKSYEDRQRAGTELVRGIMDAAHKLGLSVGVQLSPLSLPPEMAQAFGSDADRRVEASVAQLRACLEAYPQIDSLDLVLPGDQRVADQAVAAWKKLLADSKVTKRSSGLPLESHIGGHDLPRLVTIDLSQESVGVLPQHIFTPLSKWAAEARTPKHGGWSVGTILPSDAELGMYYLTRSAFDTNLTPEQAADELITTIAGPGIAERLMKGFAMVEQAGQLIEQHSPGFAAASPAIVMQHAQGSELPPWWVQVQTFYTDAMNEMYRGNTRARDGGRDFILYYARRFEFGLTYMASLQSLRQAAVAKAKKDAELQQQQLEASAEAMYNALGAFSEVARDPSDRGVIALLNEFAYRPLLAELQAMDAN